MAATAMRIVFRVGALAGEGARGLPRCVSLAQALRAAGAECRFVCSDAEVVVIDPVAGAGFDLHRLPPQALVADGADEDARQTVRAIMGLQPDWLLVDHPGLGPGWLEAVAAAAGCGLGVMSDQSGGRCPADLVIDCRPDGQPLAPAEVSGVVDLLRRQALRLRAVTLEDATTLFEWRNDEGTRRASHSHAPVGWAEHLQWLQRALADPDCQLFIACVDGQPVGTVRVDAAHAGPGQTWRLLSWTVAPQARGHGIGARMVRRVATRLPGLLRAEIRVGNLASVRVAEAAGFKLVDEQAGVLRFVRQAG